MADSKPVLLEAVAHARSGDWERAHAIAQDHEGDATADWLHGVVHWIEGDLSNARYWFGQASRPFDGHATPEEALAAIEAALRR